MWAYLHRVYGVPEVDNTEHLPDLINAHAAALTARAPYYPRPLERLTRHALSHTTGGRYTHPLWESLDSRLTLGDEDDYQNP